MVSREQVNHCWLVGHFEIVSNNLKKDDQFGQTQSLKKSLVSPGRDRIGVTTAPPDAESCPTESRWPGRPNSAVGEEHEIHWGDLCFVLCVCLLSLSLSISTLFPFSGIVRVHFSQLSTFIRYVALSYWKTLEHWERHQFVPLIYQTFFCNLVRYHFVENSIALGGRIGCFRSLAFHAQHDFVQLWLHDDGFSALIQSQSGGFYRGKSKASLDWKFARHVTSGFGIHTACNSTSFWRQARNIQHHFLTCGELSSQRNGFICHAPRAGQQDDSKLVTSICRWLVFGFFARY